MEKAKLSQQLLAIANVLDGVSVIGRDNRMKLTTGVDALVSLANNVCTEAVPEENKDVVTDEHDCAES